MAIMKKNSTRIIIPALVWAAACCLPGCSVQKNIQRSDLAYDSYHYNEAIYQYESIRKKDNHVLGRLADAYRLVGNSAKAEEYYAQLFASGGGSNDDLLHYAEVLKMNGKYDEALTKMEDYNSRVSGEKRIQLHIADKQYYTPLMSDNGQFKLSSLKMNSAESDFAATWCADRVVFTSSRRAFGFTSYEYNWNVKNFLNLYSFRPDSTKSTAVKNVKEMSIKGRLNRKYHEGPAAFNAAGTFMVFTRDRYTAKEELNNQGIRVLELWYSQKDAEGNWGEAQPMPFNNKEYNVGHASLNADASVIWFVSDMPGGFGSSDIYYSVKNTDGSWGEPINAGSQINTEGKEMFPFIHDAGVLFFASDGHAGLGGLDIFMSTGKNQKMSRPVNLGTPVNSRQDDFALVLDGALRKGYLSSNRTGGKGSDDIYAVELLKPLRLTKRIEGLALDKQTRKVLPGSNVRLYDDQHNLVAETTADENGRYSFDVAPDALFNLNGQRDTYTDAALQVSTVTQDEVIIADLLLEHIPEISLSCFVSEVKSGSPVAGARIRIINKADGQTVADVTTDAEGFWKKDLAAALMNQKLDYSIALDKEGYVSKNLDFAYTISKEGEIKVHEQLDLTMGKIELGTDIGKLIDIKPIYFDLGKYAIRKDAAMELDKIVAVMNQYPSIVIELGSHTDCRGSASSNTSLSDKRAKASANYIISKGIPKERIYGKGYGESKLVNGCSCEGNVKSSCGEDEHQLNRRTEFVIVKINEENTRVK